MNGPGDNDRQDAWDDISQQGIEPNEDMVDDYLNDFEPLLGLIAGVDLRGISQVIIGGERTTGKVDERSLGRECHVRCSESRMQCVC